MKPEAQRIAIAEACGWTHNAPNLPTNKGTLWVNPNGRINYGCCFPAFPPEVPNYLTDLNAMQSAVMEKRDVLGGYCMKLRQIVRRDTPEEYDVYGDINYYHATAAQRAEAFLRCVGKWVD